MAFVELQAQLAKLTSQLSQYAERTTMQSVPTFGASFRQGYQANQFPQRDWHDHSNSMWWEPQQPQQETYWQPYEEFYSRPMQPPQPHMQYAKSNSGLSKDYNQILNELNSLVQGSRNQAKEVQQETYWQPYEDSYAPPQPPPQSSHPNSGRSNYYKEVIQQLNSLEQGREAQPFQQDAFWQPIEDFYKAKELAEWNNQFGQNAECMEQIQEQMVEDEAMDELLLLEEEEDAQGTAREEQPLPQPPNVPTPPNSSKVVSNSIISNLIPPNVPFPHRFMQSTKDEGKKDILETFPKIQEEEVVGDYVESIEEDIFETTKPKEVEFDDIGQVITITCNLAKSNIPTTFKDVVFVIELVSEQASKPSSPTSILFSTNLLVLMIQAPTLEFRPLPDHFKYHLPFKDQFHAVGPRGA